MKPTDTSDRKNKEPAKRVSAGGAKVSVDELVGMGRTVMDRVRPLVKRAVDRLKSRL